MEVLMEKFVKTRFQAIGHYRIAYSCLKYQYLEFFFSDKEDILGDVFRLMF